MAHKSGVVEFDYIFPYTGQCRTWEKNLSGSTGHELETIIPAAPARINSEILNFFLKQLIFLDFLESFLSDS